MMVRLEIKVPSRISVFSINSESKGGIVLLSFDEHIKDGDFVVLFTLAGKLNISIYWIDEVKKFLLAIIWKGSEAIINISKPK